MGDYRVELARAPRLELQRTNRWNAFVIGPSGAGKTRTLYELASKRFGILLECADQARGFGAVVKQVFYSQEDAPTGEPGWCAFMRAKLAVAAFVGVRVSALLALLESRADFRPAHWLWMQLTDPCGVLTRRTKSLYEHPTKEGFGDNQQRMTDYLVRVEGAVRDQCSLLADKLRRKMRGRVRILVDDAQSLLELYASQQDAAAEGLDGPAYAVVCRGLAYLLPRTGGAPYRTIIVAGTSLSLRYRESDGCHRGIGYRRRPLAVVHRFTPLPAEAIRALFVKTLGLTQLECAGVGAAIASTIGGRGRWPMLVLQALCATVQSIDEGVVRRFTDNAVLTKQDWIRAAVMASVTRVHDCLLGEGDGQAPDVTVVGYMRRHLAKLDTVSCYRADDVYHSMLLACQSVSTEASGKP